MFAARKHVSCIPKIRNPNHHKMLELKSATQINEYPAPKSRLPSHKWWFTATISQFPTQENDLPTETDLDGAASRLDGNLVRGRRDPMFLEWETGEQRQKIRQRRKELDAIGEGIDID